MFSSIIVKTLRKVTKVLYFCQFLVNLLLIRTRKHVHNNNTHVGGTTPPEPFPRLPQSRYNLNRMFHFHSLSTVGSSTFPVTLTHTLSSFYCFGSPLFLLIHHSLRLLQVKFLLTLSVYRLLLHRRSAYFSTHSLFWGNFSSNFLGKVSSLWFGRSVCRFAKRRNESIARIVRSKWFLLG